MDTTLVKQIKKKNSIFRSKHVNFPKITTKINLSKQMIYELTHTK